MRGRKRRKVSGRAAHRRPQIGSATVILSLITALLRAAGWLVNNKRVERIWKRESLNVPPKQPKIGRLWLNDGSYIRLRPEYPNHVWSYDFVEDRTHDGRKFRLLNVIDEFTHECLAIRVRRKLRTTEVIDVLSDLFILRGVPGHIRSDNGAEFASATQLRKAWTQGSNMHEFDYLAPELRWVGLMSLGLPNTSRESKVSVHSTGAIPLPYPDHAPRLT